MPGLALALHLLLAAPPSLTPQPTQLVPPLDAGPFQARELAASSAGVLLGDALVIGAAYETLQLFAAHTFQPTAGNFRTAAYSLGGAALLVPPLTAALFSWLARAEPASGSFWKAALLGFVGQAVALGVGYLAYPRIWVVPPAQVVAITLGASLGLHWGPGLHARSPAGDAQRREPVDPAPTGATAAGARVCPDPLAGTVSAATG